MRVNVARQLKEPMGSTRSYRVNEVLDVAGDGGGSLVRGDILLTRTDRGILAKGILHTTVGIACSRCLSSISCPLTLNIEEEYYFSTDVMNGAQLASLKENGSFIIDGQHILDLTEAIRQSKLLAIPMKPLCCADCAGLCPECGHNLNQGPCDCPQQIVDPRWSKLSQLTSADNALNRKEGK